MLACTQNRELSILWLNLDIPSLADDASETVEYMPVYDSRFERQ